MTFLHLQVELVDTYPEKLMGDSSEQEAMTYAVGPNSFDTVSFSDIFLLIILYVYRCVPVVSRDINRRGV